MGASVKNIKCICVFLKQQYHQIFPNDKYVLLFEPGTELQSNSEYKQGGKKEKRTIINEWHASSSYPTSHSSAPYEDTYGQDSRLGSERVARVITECNIYVWPAGLQGFDWPHGGGGGGEGGCRKGET